MLAADARTVKSGKSPRDCKVLAAQTASMVETTPVLGGEPDARLFDAFSFRQAVRPVCSPRDARSVKCATERERRLRDRDSNCGFRPVATALSPPQGAFVPLSGGCKPLGWDAYCPATVPRGGAGVSRGMRREWAQQVVGLTSFLLGLGGQACILRVPCPPRSSMDRRTRERHGGRATKDEVVVATPRTELVCRQLGTQPTGERHRPVTGRRLRVS